MGRWSTPRPGRFTPRKDPVPIAYEAEWAPGPFGRVADNLAPTAIRSPDRPARSESLYRLRYPGPPKFLYYFKFYYELDLPSEVISHIVMEVR
jgi:hypothetical protein